MARHPRRLATSFIHDQRGTITILSAVILPVMMGVVALGVEFGNALLVKSKHQQVADLAAYAGAKAYMATQSTSSMDAVIASVAAMNGRAGAATGSLVGSPRANGRQAVQVVVATQQPIFLAKILGVSPSVRVSAPAFAEISAAGPACVIALKASGTGVTLSGGVSLTAADCGVASNAAVAVPCGTTLTTKNVTYNSTSAPSNPCGGIRPPAGTASVNIAKVAASDPLEGEATVTLAAGRLSAVTAQNPPAAPAVSGGANVEFGWNASATIAAVAPSGCQAAFASPIWTVTCPNDGTYTFGAITLGGGITLRFNVNGTAATTYNFSGGIDNSGTAIQFGPGVYRIARGLRTGGGSTTTFGAGSFTIGQWASSCSGAGLFSICHTGTTLSFGGPSTFKMSSGLYVHGGSTLTMGSGSTNSYEFGASNGGDAIYLGGGSKTFLADATGASSLFRMSGNVNVASGGGSCLRIPAAAQHDIRGFLSTAGGTILGAGAYTITGYAAFGGNGGGDVVCWGSNVGVLGENVTLAIGASVTPTSGGCTGLSFCLAAGYSTSTLRAPTTGPYANLLVVGPLGGSTAGASFAQGATNSLMSGAFYVPNGAIAMSGGASLGSGAGECLQIIGSQVSLTGGSAFATSCLGGGSAGQTVALVQ